MNQDIIKKNLKMLWLTDNEIKVYLSLTWIWESSVINISKKSWLPRTTVKSILDRLIEEWYVSINKYNNKNNYWIESPEILKKKFEAKVELSDNLNHLLKEFYHSNKDIPFAQIYDTKQSISSFIEKTLFSIKKDSIIKVIESPKEKNYNVFFTQEYFEKLVSFKKKNNIITKALIQNMSFITISRDVLNKQDIIIKEMSERINFEASLWIIEDKLILFSWKIPFIIEINNRIISRSIWSVFDFIWEISEEKYSSTQTSKHQ